MSDAIEASLFHRLLNTPLSDIVRGRMSGRLDWRARLASADLPTPAREMIERVVKRTRLKRTEKAAVAGELAAHVQDAIAAKQPVQTIVIEFGDERQAARLIRRAKIRNRPVPWRVWRWVRRGSLLVAILYAGATAEFFLAHPMTRVDYAAELTKSWSGVPKADLAWPSYRQAILDMFFNRPADARRPPQENYPAWLGNNIDGTDWPKMQRWLRQHAGDVALIRQAAAMPALGFPSLSDTTKNDPLRPKDMPDARIDSDLFIDTMSNWYYPYMHSMADVLYADAKLAQIDHDGIRLQADVEGMLGLADQTRGNDHLVLSSLVAIGIDSLAMQCIERILQNDPRALSDRQLTALAHRISRPRTDSDLVTFAHERLLFYDAIQRLYSDDGHGNGHITADGVRHLLFFTSHLAGEDNPQVYDAQKRLTMALGPGVMLLSPSRKELISKYDELLDVYEANLHRPARDADWRFDEQMCRTIEDSHLGTMRYGILVALAPALDGVMSNAERYLGRRDGVITAIALELYRRQRGSYPSRLQALVPLFMPEIPADRITGDPIKYKLVGGKPLLYSVGEDRIDDGGIPAINPSSKTAMPNRAAVWSVSDPSKLVRGDWILYPQLAPER